MEERKRRGQIEGEMRERPDGGGRDGGDERENQRWREMRERSDGRDKWKWQRGDQREEINGQARWRT